MKTAVRTFALVAALAGCIGLGASPASAADVAAFTGTATIACFGCGASTGTAKLCVTGVHVEVPPGPDPILEVGPAVCVSGLGTAPNVFATYTVQEGSDVNCVVSGTAEGTTTGALAVSFNWTRVGAVAVISTTGDVNGSGVAAFVVTGPAGLPCGAHNLTAEVAGAILGA